MPLAEARMGRPDPVVLSTASVPEFQQVSVWGNQAGASTATGTANRAWLFPVYLADPHTYVKAWWLNGATASGNVDVGIGTVSGTTWTRIVACTAEAQAGVSAMQVAATFTSTTLSPGLYYIAISASSATATFWRIQTPAGSFQPGLGSYIGVTSHPLGSTVTVATSPTQLIPIFGFSESTAV